MAAPYVLRSASVVLAATLSGCATPPSVPPPASDPTFYLECFSFSDCGFEANVCQYFAVNYGPDDTVATQLCTVTCANDTNCPVGFDGRSGFCAPFGFLGNELAACVPRCFSDRDCPQSTICIDASFLTTGGVLPTGTFVCAPG